MRVHAWLLWAPAFVAAMTEFQAGAPVQTARPATAAAAPQAAPTAQPGARLGQHINIVV